MIYLDNGATTRVDDAVVAAMTRYFSETFANAASLHRPGVEAARGVRSARETFADLLGVEPKEIVFTSGGTEADVLAIRGAALVPRRHDGRANVVCSAIEHPAVLDSCRSLEDDGFEVRVAPVDASGVVRVDALLSLVDDGTALVSVMHANNELGTLQPIAEIGHRLRRTHPDVRFHVDAVQSFLKAPLSVHDARVDLLSLSSHKIHGPKGAGLLWVRDGVRLRPLFHGGGQQRGVRPGTENVPGIVGFAEAARLGAATRVDDVTRMTRLRDTLIGRALAGIRDTSLNGHATERLCNNANINFHGCAAEMLLHHLEAEGIVASSGSACHSAESEPSHVLKAIGVDRDRGSIRFTLCRHTTAAEVEHALAALERVVPVVRELSRKAGSRRPSGPRGIARVGEQDHDER